MSNIISDEVLKIVSSQPRVCLPYGLELLDLARWCNFLNERQLHFKLIYGDEEYHWEGADIIDLFNTIQIKCEDSITSYTYVISKKDNAMYFFDIYDRYSFFSASEYLVDKLYPFSREILWESYVLQQEKDVDHDLKTVFETVYSR